MNRHLTHSRINYVHSLTGNFSAEVSGIIKTMHTGFKRVHVLHYANAPVLTRKTGRYDLAWKDLCSVLNALSKYWNCKRYSNIFYV